MCLNRATFGWLGQQYPDIYTSIPADEDRNHFSTLAICDVRYQDDYSL